MTYWDLKQTIGYQRRHGAMSSSSHSPVTNMIVDMDRMCAKSGDNEIITISKEILTYQFSWKSTNIFQLQGDLTLNPINFDGWQGKSEGVYNYDCRSNVAQIGSKYMISSMFRAVWTWNLTDDIDKQQGASSMSLQALCIIP